jgi:hypothetical protein
MPQQPSKPQPSPVQPTMPSQGPEGFAARGTIGSIIFANTSRWVATGNFSMVADLGHVESFRTNMNWYDAAGKKAPSYP